MKLIKLILILTKHLITKGNLRTSCEAIKYNISENTINLYK